MNTKKIEYYKNRTIGERFSASVDFLKQNWKMLYKNILYGGLPLALILGFLMQYYMRGVGNISDTDYGALSENILPIILLFPVSWFFASYISAVTGAIIILYDTDELKPDTGFREIWKTALPLIGKTMLITFLLAITIGIGCICLGMLIGFLGSAFGLFFTIILVIILGLATLAITPALSIVFFPAFFREFSATDSIREAFRLGFRHWASLFVTILLIGIIAYIVSIIFTLPSQILFIFSPGEISVWTFLLSTLASVGNLLVTPAVLVFLAFQYFSIVEEEEGISLQEQVDDFEKL